MAVIVNKKIVIPLDLYCLVSMNNKYSSYKESCFRLDFVYVKWVNIGTYYDFEIRYALPDIVLTL